MVRDGVSVRAEIASLIARYGAGEVGNVRSSLREIGLSKSAFYKYVNRFRLEEVDGLYPRSRRPLTCPTAIPAVIADAVVLARKRLTEEGWDAGADQILFWLADHPERWQPQVPAGVDVRLPSRASVNRILKDRGLIIAMPQRAPRKPRRFEHDQPNTMWQMDGFEARPGGRGGRSGRSRQDRMVVLHIVDDCSRVDIALDAVASENAVDVWNTFRDAAAQFGLPRLLLTDNGTAFSGRRRGWTSALEENLTRLGVRHLTCSVGHPGTCGKCERAHYPVEKWLTKQPLPDDRAGLQALLDTYRERNNCHRRRTHLGGLTPMQRYQLGPLDGPGTRPLPAPLTIRTAKVSARGSIGVQTNQIGLGRAHADKTVHVIRQGDNVTVIDGHRHLASFTAQGRHRYQSARPQTPGTMSTKS